MRYMNQKRNKKSIMLAMLMSCVFVLAACGNSESNNGKSEDDKSNVLVAYYSYSGTTEGVAQQIASLTGGDLVEIERVTPYDSDTFQDDAKAEIQNGERPEITVGVENIDEYDIIMVGYPNWYKEAPAMIATFLESYDFTGKTIVPFCTSGSDEIDSTLHIFSEICPNSTIGEALTANNEEDIEPWLESLVILK